MTTPPPPSKPDPEPPAPPAPDLLVAEAAFVQPGDVLILRTAAHLSSARAEDLKEVLLAKMPDLADVVVITGVDQMAVHRPHATRLAGDDAPR